MKKKCFEHFKKLCNHNDCRIRYVICNDNIKVFYYYDDDELFDVNKDIDILRQFLKKCKFNINGWNTTAEIGMKQIVLKQITVTLLQFLTRLDMKKR